MHLSPQCVEHLCRLTHLRHLDLTHVSVPKRHGVLRALSFLREVEALSISESCLEHVHFPSLPRLRSLTLHLCELEGLSGLYELEALTSLNMSSVSGESSIFLPRDLRSLKLVAVDNEPRERDVQWRASALQNMPNLHALETNRVAFVFNTRYW